MHACCRIGAPRALALRAGAPSAPIHLGLQWLKWRFLVVCLVVCLLLRWPQVEFRHFYQILLVFPAPKTGVTDKCTHLLDGEGINFADLGTVACPYDVRNGLVYSITISLRISDIARCRNCRILWAYLNQKCTLTRTWTIWMPIFSILLRVRFADSFHFTKQQS